MISPGVEISCGYLECQRLVIQGSASMMSTTKVRNSCLFDVFMTGEIDLASMSKSTAKHLVLPALFGGHLRMC